MRIAPTLITTRLFLNSLLLSLRSRRGFNTLLALVRTLIVIAIAFNIDTTESTISIVLSIYSSVSILSLILSVFKENISEFGAFHFSFITIDTLAISFFMFHRQSMLSEYYLLFLLPLITIAHFLPRNISLYVFFVILILYGVTLAKMQLSIEGTLTSKSFWIWSTRSLFLAISTMLYRVQRSLPSTNETKIISPKKARLQLEELMTELREVVNYDTISLQLLYRDRLVIVACRGFEKEKEIYRIEFPVKDPKFPNHFVILRKKWFIADVKDYPSFQDSNYHAAHIKTWMGIPLISPSNNELIGLLSIDSSLQNAYSSKDAAKAMWFARQASMLLIEFALGPAALTQATRRESIELIVDIWKKQLSEKVVKCVDDFQAARAITKIGQEVFNVEDCSMYLLRSKFLSDNKEQKVLHLIASSAIPQDEYSKYESKVTSRQGSGLTGYAITKDKTLNLNSLEIKRSPHHAGQYDGHLKHLASGRSKQVMIVPIRDFSRTPIGVLKLENKIGVASENRFSHLEQNLFENFTHTIGLILEGIRLRNYSNRQNQNLHNMRGIFSDAILKPLDFITANLADQIPVDEKSLELARKGSLYVATVIDNILFDSTSTLYLENMGLFPALDLYVSLLASGIPTYRDACACVSFLPTNARDNLPYPIKAAFFNIGREALLNAIRHSKVELKPNGKIEVDFSFEEIAGQKLFLLKVMDNGEGFSLSSKRQMSTSFGLADMEDKQKEIIKEAGRFADVILESTIGKGTVIKAVWSPEGK